MLNYTASSVIAVKAIESNDYSFADDKTGKIKTGTTIFSDVTCISTDGASLCSIRVKGKTRDEVATKIKDFKPGKPAVIPIKAVKLSRGGLMSLEG